MLIVLYPLAHILYARAAVLLLEYGVFAVFSLIAMHGRSHRYEILP